MRGYNNYSYVIDANYQPFSLQEMLTPMLMYKDAYEKSEETFNELTDKADKFKYLSKTLPEGSTGREIYEGYANELNAQAMDLARNGLSMNNRRALTNLKRRYQGEIGRLDLADQALQEEKKLRRQMNAKDSSMLYADDNLSIDQFLDNNTPNLYNISGTELYTRGAAAGKAAASRMYSAGDEGSTLGGYYKKWVERNGYSKESIDAFRANASAIPELQKAADDILAERGALENLKGANLKRARQSVLNGIIDGAVYNESIKPVRDEGVMSAAQKASNALGWANHNESVRQHNLQLKMAGYDPETGEYDSEKDQAVKKARAIAEAKVSGSFGGGSGSSKRSQLTNGVRVTWSGSAPSNDQETDYNDPNNKTWKNWKNDIKEEDIDSSTKKHSGRSVPYVMLPYWAKEKADVLIGDGNPADYNFWLSESGDSWFGEEPTLEIVPRKSFTGSSMFFDPAAIEALLSEE